MATRAPHIDSAGNTCEIVVLENHETIANQCSPFDVAIKQGDDGLWYVAFVGVDGEVSGWDVGYETAQEAQQDVKENV